MFNDIKQKKILLNKINVNINIILTCFLDCNNKLRSSNL